MTDPRTLPGLAPLPFVADLARHGERLAVLGDDGPVTYRELADRVGRVRDVLGATRRLVLLAAANDLDSLVTYLAALAGGHPLLLVPGDKPGAVTALTDAYDPDVVATGGRLDERRPGTRHELHPDLALLLSTSGSTGSPKLVRLSHTNLQSNAEAIATYLRIRPEDRAATTLPMHYCYGLSVVNSHLLRGAGLVLTGLSVVDPCFWRLVRRHEVTTFAGVPYTFDLLDRVGFADMDLPHLRYVTQAGGRLAPDRVRAVAQLGQRRGWDLVVMYGQTEATARMAYLPPDLATARPEAIGVPVPGGSLRVDPVDDAPDGAGELVYTGPNVMLGYADTPADLALGRTVTELRTGDLARRAPDGLFEVVGRRSRFVKVVGLRIDLGRVEGLLAGAGVPAACAGADDRLVVAVEGRWDVRALAQRLADDLGLPRSSVEVHALEALPRLPSGKPDLTAVRSLARPAAAAQDPGVPQQRQVTGPDGLVALFAELLDRPDATADDTFVTLGGDSLSYVEMSVRLEQALGHLPDGWHVTPIGQLAPRARRHRLASMETSVFLRAVAIVLIVGTHASLFTWQGTAHVLMAVAGFNFARFQLAGDRRARLRRQLRSVVRVVVPSVAFIALAYVLTDRYSPANILLLNALVGPERWTTTWHFWFVEVLVYVLLAMAALLAVPWASAAERRFRLGFPLALVGVGLLGRYGLVDLGVPNTKPVLWLFALGWAVAQARTTPQRLGVSALAVATVPGFFDDPRRDWLIVAGLLVLTWVRGIPSPRLASRVAGVLASASLYVYLTHWLVYPELRGLSPALALVGSLAVGVAYWALAERLQQLVGRRGRMAACTCRSGG
ncbi:MAG: AMP-binding protein [Actinomycetes bacterium]